MAETVTLQTLLTYLTLISVPVGVFYHIMTLRNTRKNQELQLETRQAQLLMHIFNILSSQESWRNYLEAQYQTEFRDYKEFHEKYGRDNPEFYSKILTVWHSFNFVGSLLHQGLLNAERVNEVMGTAIISQWEKWSDVIKSYREENNMPTSNLEFEYLYNRMRMIRTPEHIAERLKELQNMDFS